MSGKSFTPPLIGSRWYKQTDSGIKCCTVVKRNSGRAVTDIGVCFYQDDTGEWQDGASPLAHAYEFKKLLDYVRANIHLVTDEFALSEIKYFIDNPV